MEKMLALVTEEALLCARLSPEGDHHDDSDEDNHCDDGVGTESSISFHQTIFWCPRKPNLCLHLARWTVVGLVAWGIGCGSHVPGVYTNVHHYKQWINSIN